VFSDCDCDTHIYLERKVSKRIPGLLILRLGFLHETRKYFCCTFTPVNPEFSKDVTPNVYNLC
jgi:hypothetical protein